MIVSSILNSVEYQMVQELTKNGPKLKNGRGTISGTIKELIKKAYTEMLLEQECPSTDSLYSGLAKETITVTITKG